ncbi:hypothetical protein FJZ53_03760 [Candidatus Woesearchaeota archaeon]|nr:hypothetical protein [Candidatus Woesearchaeota archaeon]
MNKWLIALLFIVTLLLVGCKIPTGNAVLEKESLCNKPYFEFMKGQCCLDSNNNQICDKDEIIIQSEEKKEETQNVQTESNKIEYYWFDFEVMGLFTDYDYSHNKKEFTVEEISYKIVNQESELDNLRMKVEIYQDGKKIVESDDFLLEKEPVQSGETRLGMAYVGLNAYLSLIGTKDIPLKVKIIVYQKDYSIELSYSYTIKFEDGRVYLVNPSSSSFLFDFETVPSRFSTDGLIEFMTIRRSTDYIDYRIKNVGSKQVNRDFVLDYYCKKEKGASFMINDYYSYLHMLYLFKVQDEFYQAIPTIINPDEKIEKQIPTLSCDSHVLLLRKGGEYYVRSY